MLGSDFLFGWIVAQVLKKDQGQAPARPATSSPHPGHAHAAHAAAPATTTSSPATSSPAPAPPPMPVNVVVPPPTSDAGFKKAVEVWRVRPDVAAQATMIAGDSPMTLSELERAFPAGWIPATVVTPEETKTAIALTKQWTDGRVIFMGPSTLAARRAYRMTKHSKTAPAVTAPIPSPPVAPATVPASVSTPAPVVHPAVVEVMQPPPPPPPQIQAAKAAQRQETTVRKNEGLAQVAKRLGQPETAQSASALRAANVPQGPDAQWQAKKLTDPERGIKKVGRAGGLQPGDRLFVPPEWGRIDPARL